MAQRDINLEDITFLVAEENEGSRKLASDILLALGAREVIVAATVDQATASLKSDPVDFLICDFHLGDGKGAELIRKLRSDRDSPARYVPVIITCSHIRLAELQAARDSGANMLLAKPYSVQSLYDRLSWVAHRPRPFVTSNGYNGPDRRVKDEELDHDDRRSAEPANDAAPVQEAS